MNTIKCISPIDGSVYIERPSLNFNEAWKAIEQSQQAQKNWQLTPLTERIDKVKKAVNYLGEINNQIVPELAHMMGRPVRYRGEFGGVKERTDYMATIAQDGLANIFVEDSDQFVRKIVREPHGVVMVIAPWNYPYLTAINTIVPALIAGNTVVLKHASQTLKAGERLQEAFQAAGISTDVFQNLFLDHDITTQLIKARGFGFINFTGSVKGGAVIESAAAGTFTPLGLELGGKDPGYVMEDADLDVAVETLIDAAMYNSGQCCCGIERIYICAKHYDTFIEKAVEAVSKYKLGNPLDEETTLGPMANLRFAETVRSQVKEAVREGARPLIDSKLFPQDGGTYVMPQLLAHVDHSMRVMREESFGPIAGIMKVENDEKAISLMNDSPYGLTVSLWTNDVKRAEKIGEQIQTGTVFMNRADYLDPALCWTGCKDTGRGGGLSIIGYHHLTRVKSYHLKRK